MTQRTDTDPRGMGTMTRTRRITRALLVAASTTAALSPFVLLSQDAGAHTCVWVEGIGECHSEPWPSGHDCVENEGVVDVRACADLPV